MQDAPDTDFEIEIKLDSRGTFTYQGQGILIQEDDDTYVRFDLVYTSSDPQIYAGYFDAGVLTTASWWYSGSNADGSLHPNNCVGWTHPDLLFGGRYGTNQFTDI